VINVSWDDAKAYVAWLSRTTGKPYRLLSEAEREYVTRTGTATAFWWGSVISPRQANYVDIVKAMQGEYRPPGRTVPVDWFQPNPWGLYQVHGNVWDWTEDCWHDNYDGAPSDGSAWTGGATADCHSVIRGGAWNNVPMVLRAAKRYSYSYFAHMPVIFRYNSIGFRVGRTLITP
jgi:formylglycine-generating enzyme required for sulfatase activity